MENSPVYEIINWKTIMKPTIAYYRLSLKDHFSRIKRHTFFFFFKRSCNKKWKLQSSSYKNSSFILVSCWDSSLVTTAELRCTLIILYVVHNTSFNRFSCLSNANKYIATTSYSPEELTTRTDELDKIFSCLQFLIAVVCSKIILR